jgi:exonuclease SbcC
LIPLTLKISALGPYAGTQAIDFRPLNAARAFLITGPTGGGKTTLFDAMQFALFGETTGGERQASDMRSDLADPASRTEVDFRFALGAETYRIKRSPYQERPKLRGEGMTKEQHKATLWRITGFDVDDDQGGEVLATKVSDVNRTVHDLLGLTAEEFRQIVVLPQDRFRELLTAGSGDREEILRTLFQTRFYARIQELLKERSKAAEREQQEQRDHVNALLQDAELDTTDALRERAKTREQELESAKAQTAEHRQAYDKAARHLEDARRLATLFSERDQRAQELQTLTANAESIDQLRDRIKRAERAQSVISSEDALTAARQRLETARAQLEQAAARRERARTTADNARTALEQENARDDQRETARAEVQRLEELAPRIDRLRVAEQRVQKAAKSLDSAKKAHEAATNRLEKARDRASRAERAQRTAEDAQARLPGAEAEAKTLAQTLDNHDRLSKLVAELSRDQAKIDELQQTLDRASQNRTSIEGELEAALDTFNRHHAARLAGTLVAEAPCPVCGSKEHPAPADAAEEITLPDIPEIRGRLKQAEEEERRTSDQLSKAQAQRDSRQEERGRLAEHLGDQADEPRDALEARRVQAAETAEIHRKNAEAIDSAQQEVTAATQERDGAEAALRDADAKWREAESEKAAADSAAEAERRDLPEGLRSKEALDTRLRQAREQRDHLDNALKQARSAKEQAEQEETAAVEAERAATTQRDTAQEDVDRAQEAFDRAIETAGFDSTEGYHAARADLAQIDDLRKQVSEHDQAIATARHRIGEIDAELGDKERPDVAALEGNLETAKQALEQAQDAQTRLSERLDADRRRIERLETLEAQMAETATVLRRIGWMARVASGDNEYRTSFERYVMAELLDEILESATARLSIMSRGRYALYRDTAAGDQRRRGGLDIVVHDDHTGKLRPASTLSGGEGFLASLALALGTSDVVQARSGGVRIDALYIDEGFGSLDAETLDQAMRVILDLQRHSDRVVGMISHVAEMRERIPVRLEVTGGRAGSHVTVRLP